MKNTIDLHLHSTYSDGEYPVKNLLALCKIYRLTTVSITDHDTMKHNDKLPRLEKGFKLKIIPGIELSVIWNKIFFHLLGYGIDHTNIPLREMLKKYNDKRWERMLKIVDMLTTQHGFKINRDVLKKNDFGKIGRYHIAKNIFYQKNNRDMLKRKNIKTISNFLEAYLLENTPCYVQPERFPAELAIQLFHEAGGMAFQAHPSITLREIGGNFPFFLKELTAFGLNGLEVFYKKNSKKSTTYLYQAAKDLKLLMSAGSDFHETTKSPKNHPGSWSSYKLQTDFSWINEL